LIVEWVEIITISTPGGFPDKSGHGAVRSKMGYCY
jgi:hypothetical protein